ncbi:MAG: hypothetical protein WCA85_07480 [Paraburkholderia sp.]|uniref:hypothetical protein n=1 Tax=Paraburkholderia sp. TaxID=1926495 RepID=UPI003C4AABD9
MSLSSIHAEHVIRAAQSSAARLGVAVCGAIGVSGGQVNEDKAVAMEGQRAWLDQLAASADERIQGEGSCQRQS